MYDRIYGAVERSMCHIHLKKFENFAGDLEKLCLVLLDAPPEVKNQIFTVFPDFPKHISRDKWLQFETWLISQIAQPVRGLCDPWCFYARCTVRTCDLCRAASEGVVLIESDSDDEFVFSDDDTTEESEPIDSSAESGESGGDERGGDVVMNNGGAILIDEFNHVHVLFEGGANHLGNQFNVEQHGVVAGDPIPDDGAMDPDDADEAVPSDCESVVSDEEEAKRPKL